MVKLTVKARKDNLLKALTKSLGIVSIACERTSISRQAYYNWCNTDEKFKQAVDEIAEMALDFVETAHYKQVKKGNSSNIIYHLKTKGRGRGYGEQKEVIHSGKLAHVGKMTDDELNDIINAGS